MCRAFGRPGGDRLSRVLRQSTIGAKVFDGRVRDGIGSCHLAKATRPAKRTTGLDDRMPVIRTGLRRTADRAEPARVCEAEVFRIRVRAIGGRDPGAEWRSDPITDCWSLVPGHRLMRAIKPNERLVPVSCTHCCASTSGLSTWWSTTALQGELVSRWVSRLDAFSGYPVRT